MGSFRKEKVGGVIQQVVAEAIARRLNDPRVSPLTTITRVSVSGDLLFATVYLSVVGDEVAERKSLAGLRHAAGFVQRMVAEQLDIRVCPSLRFEVDESLKKIKHTMDLMRENRRTRPDLFPPEEWEKPDGGSEGVVASEVEEGDEGDTKEPSA